MHDNDIYTFVQIRTEVLDTPEVFLIILLKFLPPHICMSRRICEDDVFTFYHYTYPFFMPHHGTFDTLNLLSWNKPIIIL